MPAAPTPAPEAADPIKFAYWVPNVSGGLVVSTIEQRTDWSVNLMLLGYLHFHEGVEYFGKHVLPIVRKMEQARAGEAA